MIIRFFIFLTTLSPTIQEALWKWWYQRLSSFYKKGDFRFMNYGYASLNDEKGVALEESDEKNRFFIELYDKTLSGIDISGKKGLEVGSGRGGGADYAARYLKPASLIGVDFSKNAVGLCNRFYKDPNLRFMEGNAEKLPFEDNSFDFVFNVESSHCYGSMEAFIAEATRVLKPGGSFAWADLRKKEKMEADDRLFEHSGLEIIHKENITPHIIRALEMISEEKEKAIKMKVPSLFQGVFSEFAGVKGSAIYKGFKNGSMVYWRYSFKKPNI